MAADPDFLLRLYAESARFLQQERWQREWRVVVICPSRQLNFGEITPVREFVEQRVQWIELQPRGGEEPTEPLSRLLSLLLQPEPKVLPMIPAILKFRFNNRPIQEIGAMGGITLEEFTQSRAYREIFDLGGHWPRWLPSPYAVVRRWGFASC